MSAPSTNLPSIATTPVVAAGPDAGMTTRLEPSTAEKAVGIRADTKTAARVMNWHLGAMADWIQFLAPIQLKNWRKLWSTNIFANAAWAGSHLTGMHCNQGGLRGWLMPGGRPTTPNNGFVLTAPGCTSETDTPPYASTLAFGGSAYAMSVASNGSIVVGTRKATPTNTSVYWYSIAGTNGVERVLSASAGDASIVVVSSSTYWAFDGRANGLSSASWAYKSTDFGVTWSQIGLITTSDYTIRCAVAKDTNTIGMLAVNDASMLECSEGTVTRYPLPVTENAAGLARGSSGWWVLTEAGKVYWRADGSPTYVLTATLGITIQPGDGTSTYTKFGSFIACDGDRCLVVHGINGPANTGRTGHGLAVSIDRGVTWSYVPLATNHSTARYAVPMGVAYGSGQFMAIALEPHEEMGALVPVAYTSLML